MKECMINKARGLTMLQISVVL